jgi:hypothetical protein
MKINLKLTSLFVVSAVANMASVVLVVRPVNASTDTDVAPASFDIAVNDGAVSVATASSSPDVEEETSTTMTMMSMSSLFSSAKNLIFGSDRNAAAVAADDTIPTFPVQVDVESIIEDGEDQDDVDNDLDDELDDGEYWVWTNSSSVPDSIDGGMTVFDVDNDTNLMHGRFRLIVGGIEAKRFSGKDISIFDMVFRVRCLKLVTFRAVPFANESFHTLLLVSIRIRPQIVPRSSLIRSVIMFRSPLSRC